MYLKNIVISADGDRMVYSVPDIVADNLRDFCLEFCGEWLPTSPHAKRYRIRSGLCYNESDFIEYLNKWVFPDKQSIFIENLGWIDFGAPLPERYKDCPQFNF